jgi:hypothetical protein
MNKNQRLVLAIFVPIILFFITFTIANSVGVTRVVTTKKSFYTGVVSSYNINSFDLEKTWYVWMLYLIICFIFEYRLFGDKKKKINE